MNVFCVRAWVMTLAVAAVAQQPDQGSASEHRVVLEWPDGGRLRGTISPSVASGAAGVRLIAPQFAGELVVARSALAGIQFAGSETVGDRAAGPFRVVTTASDVWTASLLASDASSLTFRSERIGDVRVPRSAIRSIERCDDPAVLLDASRFAGEAEQLHGPIEDLRFAVYEDLTAVMRRTTDFYEIPRDARGDERVISQITDNEPDDIRLVFDGSERQFEGARSRGFLDLGLNPSEDFEMMAMVFDGRFQAGEDGRYRFEVQATHGARLFVDGELVVEGKTTAGFDGGPALREGTIELAEGAHDLRVVYFNYIKEAEFAVTVTDPQGNLRYLSGRNAEPSWDRGAGGHASTDTKYTRLWCPLDLPAQFEVSLELASSAAPRFLVSVEGDGEVPALVVETWEDLLVVTQGDVFESMGTLAADRGEVGLRLAFDGERGQLEVFTGTGRSLGVAAGLRLPGGATGISLRNRGVDLLARRLVVRNGLRDLPAQEINPLLPQVQLRDGRVLYGQLELRAGGAVVRAADGEVEVVALADVSRVLNPEANEGTTKGLSVLTWANGEVLHGEVGAIRPGSVELTPAFAAEPLTCSTAGVSGLTFSVPLSEEDGGDSVDMLVTGAGEVRGQLVFGEAAGPLAFRPIGAAAAVGLEVSADAEVRRATGKPVASSVDQFSPPVCVLHSQAGERISCRFRAWSDGTITLLHPFARGAKQIDAGQFKALDFTGETLAAQTYLTNDAFGELLERALVIPRFRRKDPDDYLVVARSGDLMRGQLVSILGGVLRLESKLKEQDVPLERLSLVVNIEERTPEELAGVRLTLDDGSVLVLTPDAVEDGLLLGRSVACGEVAVPIERITSVQLGPAVVAGGGGAFSEWVGKSAPEPSWDH